MVLIFIINTHFLPCPQISTCSFFCPVCTLFQILLLGFFALSSIVNLSKVSQQLLCHSLNTGLSWNFLYQIN
jgi:hypothetical protein